MLTFTNKAFRKIKEGLDADSAAIDPLPFPHLEATVWEGVRRVLQSELVPESFSARGFVYEVSSGRKTLRRSAARPASAVAFRTQRGP